MQKVICAELLRRKLTPYWLAQQIGVRVNHIYDMLEHNTRVRAIQQMADVLGLALGPNGRKT